MKREYQLVIIAEVTAAGDGATAAIYAQKFITE